MVFQAHGYKKLMVAVHWWARTAQIEPGRTNPVTTGLDDREEREE